MPELFDYFDYRKFLGDFYNEQKIKQTFFSYRYFGAKIKVPASNLVKILQYERHFSKTAVENFLSYINMGKTKERYFRVLVDFSKAKKESDVKKHFDKLMNMKEFTAVKMRGSQYAFYKKWYHTAITGLLDFYNFDDKNKEGYARLAAKLSPAITPTQAKESISLLKKLNIIKKNKAGMYRPVNDIITTGERWLSLAVKNYQAEVYKLALHSLEHHDRNVRDMSTLSVTASMDELEEIKELAKDFRKNVLQVTKSCEKPDKVYQVNIQIFPMSK